MATKKTEDIIRRYLDSLGKSDRPVVDREAVSALKHQIRAEGDLLEKARLLSALEIEEAGRVPDRSGEEEAFVAEALAWAEDAGVTAGALQALGVADDVLRKAGFEVKASSGARGTGRGRRASSGGGRSPAIPLDDVAAAARKLGSGWKLSDLAAVLQREPMTVRNYINKLVEQRVIADLGDDPRHGGRGRAPKIYGMA